MRFTVHDVCHKLFVRSQNYRLYDFDDTVLYVGRYEDMPNGFNQWFVTGVSIDDNSVDIGIIKKTADSKDEFVAQSSDECVACNNCQHHISGRCRSMILLDTGAHMSITACDCGTTI